MKPRPKPTVQRSLLNGTIFLRTSGFTTEIEDPDGKLQRLLDLMDGCRTYDEVVSVMIAELGVAAADVDRVIDQLDEHRFLEDADQDTATLSEYDLARWQRNINFLGSFTRLRENKYSLQAKIRDAHVALLGLGGLGSHLLYDLAALGVRSITAAEFDRVEISNLNRQILYMEQDIGRPKVQVATERILQFSPGLNCRPIPVQLQSKQDVVEVITGSDVVICVADRPKMEIMGWVNAACVACNIPLVTGGLDTQVCRYYTVLPGTSGCITCWHRHVARTDSHSGMLLDDYHQRNPLRGDNAAFVPFVALIAGFIMVEVSKLLTGLMPSLAAGRLHEIDYRSMEATVTEEWPLDPECPDCSRAQPPALVA